MSLTLQLICSCMCEPAGRSRIGAHPASAPLMRSANTLLPHIAPVNLLRHHRLEAVSLCRLRVRSRRAMPPDIEYASSLLPCPGFFLEHCSPPERFARSFVRLCRREPQAQANVETVGSLRWLHMFQNGLPWPWPVRNPAWPSNSCARLALAPLPRASVRLSDAGYFIRRPAWPA